MIALRASTSSAADKQAVGYARELEAADKQANAAVSAAWAQTLAAADAAQTTKLRSLRSGRSSLILLPLSR